LTSVLTDVNKWVEQPDTCVPLAQGIYTLGSFKCMCPRGYQLDKTGTQFIDNYECVDGGRCQLGCQVDYFVYSNHY
jgi:hypothetical protein